MISPHDKVSLHAMLERMLNKSEKEDRKRLMGFIMEIIEFFPQETKCQDCIFLDGKRCKKWNDDVPQEFMAQGCEHFKFDPESPPF